MTKEKPILFSAPMVQAILAGRKTQTRRVIKYVPKDWKFHGFNVHGQAIFYPEDEKDLDQLDELDAIFPCPYGDVGDGLWVRETFCDTSKIGARRMGINYTPREIEYRADMGIERFPLSGNYTPRDNDFKWTPSIHMPRIASRIDLKITGRRVERLQDISEADAIAEGIDAANIPEGGVAYRNYLARDQDDRPWIDEDPIGSFFSLWRKINGDQSMRENPFVWVMEFERVKP